MGHKSKKIYTIYIYCCYFQFCITFWATRHEPSPSWACSPPSTTIRVPIGSHRQIGFASLICNLVSVNKFTLCSRILRDVQTGEIWANKRECETPYTYLQEIYTPRKYPLSLKTNSSFISPFLADIIDISLQARSVPEEGFVIECISERLSLVPNLLRIQVALHLLHMTSYSHRLCTPSLVPFIFGG